MGAKKLSMSEEKQLVDEYLQGEPVVVLMERYGYKSKKSISDKVKKHLGEDYAAGVQTAKKNRQNFNYTFGEIKNNFDAYFIGLLLTDGYITTRGTDIGIDLIDEDCISFLARQIKTNYHDYSTNGKKRYRLIISSKEEVENIKRYGIVQRKAHILKGFDLLPSEEKFIPYIVRGIIDGDGSINPLINDQPSCQINSVSKPFLEWVVKLLEKMFIYDINISERLNEQGLIYEISINKLADIYKLLALAYNQPFGMERKYLKLKETFRDYNGSNLM